MRSVELIGGPFDGKVIDDWSIDRLLMPEPVAASIFANRDTYGTPLHVQFRYAVYVRAMLTNDRHVYIYEPIWRSMLQQR